MGDELLPCHCGRKANIFTKYNAWWRVWCGCGMQTCECPRKAQAIEIWNTRPDSKSEWQPIGEYDLSRQRTRVLTWDGVTVEDCFYGQGSNSKHEDWLTRGWRETKSEKFVRFPITHFRELPAPPSEK